jgi:photosystem II stability/assembly factor-like uncharacterized protein
MMKLKIHFNPVFWFTILLFGFLVTEPVLGQTGWRWLNPRPQGNHLSKVQALNANVIYAAGEAGTVLKTTNGGTNWRMLRTRTNLNILSLIMVHPDSGYVAGDSGLLLKTVNGGTAWFRQNVPGASDLRGVFFQNSRSGWVCGKNGFISKTQNGGLIWQTQNTASTQTLNDIRFLNPQIGWAVGNKGSIYKTNNGGSNWTAQTSGTTKNIRFLRILDADSALAVGDSGLVLKTTNGGSNWTTLFTNADNIDFQSLYSIKTDTLLVCGGNVNQDPIIAFSNDRGQNWDVTPFQASRPISSFSFLNRNTAFAVGADGELLKTEDRFQLGNSLKTGFAGDFTCSHFFSPDSGFVFGKESASSVLLQTSDGGNNWSNANSPGLFLPEDIQFLGAQTGFISGTGGSLAKTIDRGNSWVLQNTGVSQSLWGIHFANANLGYAVGTAGTILKTTNGGQNWQSQTSATGTGFRLFDAFAVNPQVAFIVGENGIQNTLNGGLNWATQLTGDTMNSLHFFNAQAGFAVGKKGKIFRTINGGQNWNQVNLGLKMDLTRITFHNATHGIITGDSGLVLLSLNGGISWVRQLSYNKSFLKGAALVNDTVAYICGSRSAILKTTTAGSTCPDALFNYTGVFLPGKFCQSDTITQSLYFDGSPGGAFSAQPAGLNINPITGKINPVASIPGNYTVQYQVTPPNGCPTQTFTTTALIQALTYIPRARLEVKRPEYALPPQTIFEPCDGDTLVAKARNQFANLKFAWYKNNQLLPDTTQELKVSQSGMYAVKYREQACAGPFYDTVQINFEEAKKPKKPGLSLLDPPQSCNDDFTLGALVAGTVNFEWVNEFGVVIPGQTGNNLTQTRPGTYRIQIDSLGCKNISEPITILPVGADTVLPQLFTVTTEGSSVPAERNRVEWNRVNYDTNEIKRVIVYRAVEGELFYTPIAEIPATDSSFTDLEALPQNRAYAYKISAKQLCGAALFFTPASSLQNSIHLNVARHPPNNYVLRWSEPEGFVVQKYRILRGLTYNSLTEIEDSLPGNITSFIDQPAAGSDYFYRIEATTAQSYVPWGRISAGARIRKSSSNTSPTTFSVCDSCYTAFYALPILASSPFQIFPNPHQEEFTLSGLDPKNSYHFQMVNFMGQMVGNEIAKGENQFRFQKKLPSGPYLLKVESKGQYWFLRIIRR